LGNLKQWFIIVSCLFTGNYIAARGIPIPGNVIGMILLLGLLLLEIIDLTHVERTANILLEYLGLFLIPGNVALIVYKDVLGENIWPILGTAIVSTLLVLGTTGHVTQFIYDKTRGEGFDT